MVAKLQGSNTPRGTAFEAAPVGAGVGVEGDGVDIADLRLETRRPAQFPVVKKSRVTRVSRGRGRCVCFLFCLGKSLNYAEVGVGAS